MAGKMSLGDIANMNTLGPDEVDEVDEELELDNDIIEEESSAEDLEEIDGETLIKDEGTKENTADSGYMAGNKAATPSDKKLEHTNPCFKVGARPSKEDLFRFLFSHTYLNPMGFVAMLIGVAAIVLVIYSAIKSSGTIQTVLLAAVALVFILNSPVSLYFKAKKQAESMEKEADPIVYAFSDAGFDMTKTDGYAAYDWDGIFLVKEGKTGIYMYLARNQAFVLPKSDLGDDLAAFKSMVISHVNSKKCKLTL